MANTALQLGQAAITTSNATLYTVPSATKTILRCFDICNTTANAITVRVHIIPSAGSAGTGNALIYDKNVLANDVLGWEGEHVMATGTFIQVKAGASGLTITASGVEVS